MSSFQEIKQLFINEISNTPQYLVAVKIKDLIIQDIITPHVNFVFTYTLQDSDYTDLNNKTFEEQIIQMGLKIILGFDVDISMGTIIVLMNKFL